MLLLSSTVLAAKVPPASQGLSGSKKSSYPDADLNRAQSVRVRRALDLGSQHVAQPTPVLHIEEVGLDEYERVVTVSEMPASWPLEAIKAQMILVRTYALHRKMQRATHDFHLTADVSDQVYDPRRWQELSPQTKQNVYKAQLLTANQVLKTSKGRLASVHYHADCGNAPLRHRDDVWGSREGLANASFVGSRHADSHLARTCPTHRTTHWRYQLKLERWLKSWLKHLQLPEVLSLEQFDLIAAVDNRFTPKAVSLKFFGAEPRRLSINELRRHVGYDQVKSNVFYIKQKSTPSITSRAERIELIGRGLGHGVGLCQQGAKTLADQGLSAAAILKFYFPDWKLAPLTETL